MARKTHRVPIKSEIKNEISQTEKYNDVLSSLDSLKVKQSNIAPETPTVIPTTKIILGVVTIAILALGVLSIGNIPLITNTNTLSGKMIDSEGVDFTFKLLNGTVVNLSDYKGAPLFLDLFATWCPPCKAQMPEFVKLKSASPNVQILSISIDESDTVKMLEDFSSEYGITWPVGQDYTLQGAKNFNVLNIPTLVFFNSEGLLRKIEVGLHDYDTLASWLAED